MEGPLLTKSEKIVDTTISGGSSNDDELIVDIAINGDSSLNGEQTPNEAEGVEGCYPWTRARVSCLIEFVLNLVQIVGAFVVLTRARDEHPQVALLVWIIGYTCGCIATLPILLMNRICSRNDEVMNNLKIGFEYFFVVWVALLVWIYLFSSSSLYNSTQHFWLCMLFLSFSCIWYVPAHLICAGICLIFVVVTWLDPDVTLTCIVLTIIIGTIKFVKEECVD